MNSISMHPRRSLFIAGSAVLFLLSACSSPEPTASPVESTPSTSMVKPKPRESAKPNPTPGASAGGNAIGSGDTNQGSVNQAAQPEPVGQTGEDESGDFVSGGNPFSNQDSASDNGVARENRNALLKAESYLNTMPFSASGLRKQLEFEQFPPSAIDYAMANLSVDWNQQAVLKARSYDSTGLGLSDNGLVDQLIYEGFTPAQAQYGVDNM